MPICNTPPGFLNDLPILMPCLAWSAYYLHQSSISPPPPHPDNLLTIYLAYIFWLLLSYLSPPCSSSFVPPVPLPLSSCSSKFLLLVPLHFSLLFLFLLSLLFPPSLLPPLPFPFSLFLIFPSPSGFPLYGPFVPFPLSLLFLFLFPSSSSFLSSFFFLCCPFLPLSHFLCPFRSSNFLALVPLPLFFFLSHLVSLSFSLLFLFLCFSCSSFSRPLQFLTLTSSHSSPFSLFLAPSSFSPLL